jgi:hypothetical protein
LGSTIVEERVGTVFLAGSVLDFEELLVVLFEGADKVELLLREGSVARGGGEEGGEEGFLAGLGLGVEVASAQMFELLEV